MPKIALDGAITADSVIYNHIYYRRYEYLGYNDIYGNPAYGYNYYYANATVKGTVKSTVANVKINGKSPVVQGDKSTENDTYSINGEYLSGAHTNAQGTVNLGNSKKVYANGKLIATGDTTVTTHGNSNVKINSGLSTNVNIGG